MAGLVFAPLAATNYHGGGLNWKRGPLLGAGSFGTVSLASEVNKGQLFAIKSVQIDTREASGQGTAKSVDLNHTLSCLSALYREREVLEAMDCPRVIRCFGGGWSLRNGVPCHNVFLEYMPGQSLSTISRRSKAVWTKMGEQLVAFLLTGILQGLQYIHSQGLVHCDIKADNILLGREGVKLADFGCATRLSEASAVQLCNTAKLKGKCSHQALEMPCHLKGSLLWLAPEVLTPGVPIATGRDVWALGCTAIELLTLDRPWGHMKEQAFTALKARWSPPIPDSASPLCTDFIKQCLVVDGSERATVSSLLKHPFVTSLPVAKGQQLLEELLKATRSSSDGSVDQHMWREPGSPRGQAALVEGAGGKGLVRNFPTPCCWRGPEPEEMMDDGDEVMLPVSFGYEYERRSLDISLSSTGSTPRAISLDCSSLALEGIEDDVVLCNCGGQGKGETEGMQVEEGPCRVDSRPCSHLSFFSDAWEFGGLQGGWLPVYRHRCKQGSRALC